MSFSQKTVVGTGYSVCLYVINEISNGCPGYSFFLIVPISVKVFNNPLSSTSQKLISLAGEDTSTVSYMFNLESSIVDMLLNS